MRPYVAYLLLISISISSIPLFRVEPSLGLGAVGEAIFGFTAPQQIGTIASLAMLREVLHLPIVMELVRVQWGLAIKSIIAHSIKAFLSRTAPIVGIKHGWAAAWINGVTNSVIYNNTFTNWRILPWKYAMPAPRPCRNVLGRRVHCEVVCPIVSVWHGRGCRGRASIIVCSNRSTIWPLHADQLDANTVTSNLFLNQRQMVSI